MLAWLDGGRPTYDEGDTCSCLVSAIFATPIMFHRCMTVQQFACLILITVIDDRPVVATENKDGIVRNAQAIERMHDFAYSPIELEDDITTSSQPTLTCKARMRYARHMNVLRTHIKEERLVFVIDNKVLSLIRDNISNIFVYPQSRFTTCHPSDTRNAVDNRIVMSLAGFQFDQFRIFFTCRPVAHFVFIADGNRIVRIKSIHTAVFYKYTRNTIDGSRNDIFIAKPYILCIGFDKAIEISSTFRAKSQMPFTDSCRSISFCLKHVGHGHTSRVDDQLRITRSNACILLTPGIHTRQQSET